MNEIETLVAFCRYPHRAEMLATLAKVAKPEFEFEIYRQINADQQAPTPPESMSPKDVWNDILSAVSEVTFVPVDLITSAHSREREYARPRHIAIWIMRKLAPHFSQTNLGNMFDHPRKHCTVSHVENKSVPSLYATEKSFRTLMLQACEILESKGYSILIHVNKMHIII
jgi:chromosomal replication initiation ATPase DnaA